MAHRNAHPIRAGDHYDCNEQSIAFDYEIAFVDGDKGRRLSIEQANAILEVLEWLGRQTPPPTP
jgi:hypothetical protein